MEYDDRVGLFQALEDIRILLTEIRDVVCAEIDASKDKDGGG